MTPRQCKERMQGFRALAFLFVLLPPVFLWRFSPSSPTASPQPGASSASSPLVAGASTKAPSPAEVSLGLDLSSGKGTFVQTLIVPANTKVFLARGGSRRCSELTSGDKVRMSDRYTGIVTSVAPIIPKAAAASSKLPPGTVARRVIGTNKRVTDDLLYVYTANELIKTTPEHPFFVHGKGWVNAGKLHQGDQVETESGGTISVVRTEPRHERTTVYNLKVEGTSNYFVGKDRLLVHNGGPCFPGPIEDLARGALTPTHGIGNPRYSNDTVKWMMKNPDKAFADPIKYVEHEGTKYIVDGHHRMDAARRLGMQTVPAQRIDLPFGGYQTPADLNWTPR